MLVEMFLSNYMLDKNSKNDTTHILIHDPTHVNVK